MLCKFCNSIDFERAYLYPSRYTDVPVGQKHHHNFQDLVESANGGCELCKLIIAENKAHRWPQHYDESDLADEQIYCIIRETFEGAPRDYRGCAEIEFRQKKFAINTMLSMYVDEDSSAAKANMISGRPLNLRHDAEKSFVKARSWIANCLSKHHDTCPFTKDSVMPTRVIDLGSEETLNPKLKVTNQEPGLWVSLSHSWGADEAGRLRYITTSESIEERKISISIEEIPPTFLDAMIVTKKLGYRYLWIDSVCILQDNHADWVAEGCHMSEYYENAVVTIAVHMTEGDHQSFLDKREEAAIGLPVPIKSRDFPSSTPVYIKACPGTLEDLNYSSPLAKRGWTLQEDVLSPRTLHYGRDQIHWECQLECQSESADVPRTFQTRPSLKTFFLKPNCETRKFHSRSRTGRFLEEPWWDIVSQYMLRSLTFPNDKFPAIAAVARQIANRTGFTYSAGIWIEDMHRGLIWATDSSIQRSVEYRAPSWSWASVDLLPENDPNFPRDKVYKLIYVGLNNLDRKIEVWNPPDAYLVHHKVTLKDGDPFGRISAGLLVLQGYWLPLKFWGGASMAMISTLTKSLTYHYPNGVQSDTTALICHLDDLPSTYPNDAMAINSDLFRDVYLFQIGRWPSLMWPRNMYVCRSLLLTPTGVEGEYRRIGVAEVPVHGILADDRWIWREITIV